MWRVLPALSRVYSDSFFDGLSLLSECPSSGDWVGGGGRGWVVVKWGYGGVVMSHKELGLLVEAIGKMVVALLLVGALVYSVVMDRPVPDELMQLVVLVLGVYFGKESVRSGRAWWLARTWRRSRSG